MIFIAGAGVAGLAVALELLRRGARIRLFERGAAIGGEGTARHAGGMLAPWCERETAEDIVVTLGAKATDWWDEVTPVTRSGTLVVARPRSGRVDALFPSDIWIGAHLSG